MIDHNEHLPLSPRDLLILASISEGPLHGYGLIKQVEERSQSGVLLDPANLYRTLRRMRQDGWIEEIQDAADRRRTHRITDSGRRVLAAELHRLERLLAHARPALAKGP